MEIKSREDVVKFFKGEEALASDLTKLSEYIESELREKLKVEANKFDAKQTELSEANNKLADLELKVNEIAEDLNRARQAETELRKTVEAKELAERKANRISAAKEIFNLNEEKILSVYAAQIENLSDEDFSKWTQNAKDVFSVEKVEKEEAENKIVVANVETPELPLSFKREDFSIKEKAPFKFNVRR